jgi:hypothetical protein
MTHKQFSAKGGKAGTGDAKARTSEQARAAVAARWAKTKRKPKASSRRHNDEVSDRAGDGARS